jgi:hypothetical protein
MFYRETAGQFSVKRRGGNVGHLHPNTFKVPIPQ